MVFPGRGGVISVYKQYSEIKRTDCRNDPRRRARERKTEDDPRRRARERKTENDPRRRARERKIGN